MENAGNGSYISLLIISNVVAILQLVASLKWPAIARFSFFFLFAWGKLDKLDHITAHTLCVPGIRRPGLELVIQAIY